MTRLRTYQRTHPWINFKIDLTKLNSNIWMALGEAQSKCEYISGVPLQPAIQKHLHTLYLAKGVHATTAIEGNTLSEEEVQKRIEGKLSLSPSREYLGKEIDNVVEGCNMIMKQLIEGDSAGLDMEEVKSFNAIVLKGLKTEKGVKPGVIRKYSVGVAGYRGAPPGDCDFLLNRMCEWLNSKEFMQKENLIAFGILRSIVAHIYIAWIHPFGDGNGRTARLVEFKLLLIHGIPSTAAHLLSNHYNQTRSEYYRQLDYASKSGGDLLPFINYAIQGFVDGLKAQIEVMRGAQMRITWRDYIYDNFRNKSGTTSERRRKLILDISDKMPESIDFKEIRHVSPRIAELYANKTNKTITRDITELIDMDLLKKEEGKYKANMQKLLAFLPLRKKSQ